jgi:hypothetical protein
MVSIITLRISIYKLSEELFLYAAGDKPTAWRNCREKAAWSA